MYSNVTLIKSLLFMNEDQWKTESIEIILKISEFSVC